MSPSTSSVVVARVLSSSASVKQNPLKRKRDDEITEEDDEHQHTEPTPPSWEALCLLGLYMEPETLAIASCVSTTWLKCFSSENLWKSLITARTAQPCSPYAFALDNTELISYKHLVSTVERDAKRRRKDKPAPEIKIALSDLSFIVHVSTGTKKASVLKKGKDLVFGPNDKFHIEADFSSSDITSDEKDVRLTWQVVYKNWEKFFTMADSTGSLDASYGWFTDKLEDKDNRKLVGDVKPSFNGDVLEKIGFAIVDSDGWGSLLVDGFLRYLQGFLLE
ncbi:LOW QUALITY PROTEIN: probable F-box protein At5g04010 [Eutrema salsugineum]|uniref:LOW QUALITY PROTEIN: probable F-box protein At5g04010 n=1 Tax=Eutrema salsugineum TaxID=72664 RepID=UPI000CED25AB|nr:LOW QUALITY PROTEIN: probable F-box protein At5g04010 [Eutrema salsugineum]